jgi:hypothetical protein
MNALENYYRRVLSNYCDILSNGFGVAPPYTVVLGAIGLQNTHVGFNNSVDGPVYNDRVEIRRVLNDPSKESQAAVVREFADAILDLAGVTRP